MIIPPTYPVLEALVGDHFNEGIYRLEKLCKAFVASNPGWDEILKTSDKRLFHYRVVALARWVSRAQNQSNRLIQLQNRACKWWIYKSGVECPSHSALDGIAVPSEHPFWLTHSPPNAWYCDCQVYGADTPAGIRRLGGTLDKELPATWSEIDPSTGHISYLEPGFARQGHPDFKTCLGALVRGVADQ
ncbi:phage minor head protein [Paracoccus yeei]|uniref:Uncharacterized protein n=1 Tax=Paracoccus yeei TaxID=147645 RepID=A0A2D2C293_9RHOB|nr:phage minor head protein [Paracoccus yeei]ATQ56633.1 hypothetical protein PYTT13_13080 [Paracoccus yeei]